MNIAIFNRQVSKVVILLQIKLIFYGCFLLSFGVSKDLGKRILKEIDQQQSIQSDVVAKMILLQTRPIQGTRRFEMVYYRRDRDDSFLIVMLAPNQEKGNGYLKKKDNFWLYRKNTRSFQHIGRDENIGGTDIRSGDLEQRKMSELYQIEKNQKGQEKIKEGKVGNIPVYVVFITAKVRDVTYPKQTLYVRKDNYLILKIQNYSKSATLLLTQYFPKYTKVGNRYIPVKGYNIDEFEKGNKTIFEIKDFSFQSIKDNVFTKAYLENLSR